MTRRTAAWLAWSLAAAVVVISILIVIEGVRRGEFDRDPGAFVNRLVEGRIEVLTAPIFALLAALILSNQPRNIIGWLLMTPALGTAIIDPIRLWIGTFETAPASLDPALFLALWAENSSWLLFLFPIFHLLQVFPTGRVLTPRWRWLAYVEVGMIVVFLALIMFSDALGPSSDEVTWSVSNPIGFIPPTIWESSFFGIWILGLLILVIGGGASTVTRFRRAQATERQQLKWLLCAIGLFAVVYAAYGVAAVSMEAFDSNIVLDVLYLLSIIAIPVAITLAVLRYRLFDIDLIIRRTLVYGLLTGLLTAVYFGSVVVLQIVFRGEGNSLTVAASTLLITALFTPLRRRMQSLIDRRLFRSKYNAQVVIERFGGAAQHQSDLETLSADLMAVVGATIQPRSGVLWIKDAKSR